MQLTIEIAGDVVDRQELLNGTQSVDIEGADEAATWSLIGSFSWNLGLIDHAGEGDMTLARSDGAELNGTLLRATVTPANDSADADFSFTIDYEVDDGAGEFAGARGRARAAGELAGETFRGVWTLELTSP